MIDLDTWTARAAGHAAAGRRRQLAGGGRRRPARRPAPFVAALAARYLLLSTRSEVWTSLAVYADETVVGHVMWGVDDDGSRWIGGMVIDAAEQGRGVGRATVRTLAAWLAAEAGNAGPPVVPPGQHRRPPPSTPPWASTPRARWRTTSWSPKLAPAPS